jgi:hypothetical protein
LNLWEIQPFVVGLLTGSDNLKKAVVLADDGTYPKTPDREKTLRETGLCLIVWQIESHGLDDFTFSGPAVHSVYVPVVIEENVMFNRSDKGTKIVAEQALQYVFEACVGRPKSPLPNRSLVPMDPPFKNFGTVNGIQRIVANLVIRHYIVGSAAS